MKTSFLFAGDPSRKLSIDQELWDKIPIPLRVVVTKNEDLVREVTVANNRQAAMSASAYRANDPEQLRLENQFRSEMKIFYERQQCAFVNLRRDDPRKLQDLYENNRTPITIEELAQAIACAGNTPLDKAARVSELFDEYEYKKLFAESTTANLQLLVFLTNLLSIMRLVLKDVKGQSTRLATLPTGRFVYPCSRILARWIVRHRSHLIQQYGFQVLRRGHNTKSFRDDIRILFSVQNTGLQQKLYQLWQNNDGTWARPSDKTRVNQALQQLGLTHVDVFDYQELAA